MTTTTLFDEREEDAEDDGGADSVVFEEWCLVCVLEDFVCFLEDLVVTVDEGELTVSVKVCFVGLRDLDKEAVFVTSYKTVCMMVLVVLYDGVYSRTLVEGTISTIVVRTISSVAEQSSVMMRVSVLVLTSCSSASWVLIETL